MAKMEKPMKYDANRIIGTHGLKRGRACEILDRLTKTVQPVEPSILPFLEELRLILQEKGDFWNEEELKMKFLSHIFYITKLEEPEKIDIFYERSLNWTFNSQVERVVCDCILAKPFGVFAPSKPYFFLQEFKKQKQNEDAEGQMLLAMLIAQAENNNEKPLFGCFLQGKNWVFTTLHGKNYCISDQLDATKVHDLHQIIGILRNLKQIILTELL